MTSKLFLELASIHCPSTKDLSFNNSGRCSWHEASALNDFDPTYNFYAYLERNVITHIVKGLNVITIASLVLFSSRKSSWCCSLSSLPSDRLDPGVRSRIALPDLRITTHARRHVPCLHTSMRTRCYLVNSEASLMLS